MKIHIFLVSVLSSLLLTSCITITVQQNNQRYTGNFRYYAGMAEFFDCKTQKKHYLADDGLADELIEAYKELKLKPKDDVYVRVEGFYKEQEQMDGVDPIDVFVPTKIIQLDTTRKCKRPYRRGL